MPPPPSPNKGLRPAPPRPQSRQSLLSSRPQSRTSIDESSEARPGTPKSAALVSLEANNTALQGKIANLMARSTSHRRTSSLASLSDLPLSRPQSEVDPEEALRKSVADEELQTQQQARINQLRARVEALEQENLGLLLERQKSPEPPSTPSATTKTFDPAVEARAVAAERQVQVHTTRLTILESELSASTQAAKNLQGSLDAAQRSMKQAEDERERERMEAKLAQKDFSARLQESEALVAGLREAVETKEKGEDAGEAETLARKKEIEVLQNRVGRLSTELEQERTELGAQVDALRKAGQVRLNVLEIYGSGLIELTPVGLTPGYHHALRGASQCLGDSTLRHGEPHPQSRGADRRQRLCVPSRPVLAILTVQSTRVQAGDGPRDRQ